jgi:hypothetical protein
MILTGAAEAGFVGLKTVGKPVAPWLGITWLVNLFAVFDRPGQDRFLSAAGTPASPMDIHVFGGTFYQNPFGTDLAPNAAFLNVFPSIAYDTFVTIGQKSTAQPAPPLTLTPGWSSADGIPGGSGFGPSSLVGNNIGWANTPADPNTDPFNPQFINGNGQVLIGQFAVAGMGITGMFRVLVISNNVSTQMNVMFAYFVPAPGGALLMAMAGGAAARRRRRR